MNEKTFYLALNETGKIGYRLFQKLMQVGSIQELVSSPEKVLNSTLPREAKNMAYDSLRSIQKINMLEQKIFSNNWHIYSYKELLPHFPENKEIPLLLTGSFPLSTLTGYTRRIAIVGTCYPSIRALQITREIVNYLSRFKVLIISGLARGIDCMAHDSSLKSGGETLAFLPYGLNNLSPGHLRIPGLYFLSEAPYYDKWGKKWAILRNRLIALFCDSIVVIQSRPFGGSFYTAQYGIKYGRNVFVVDFEDDCKEGNRILLNRDEIRKIRCRADLKQMLV